MAVSLTFLLILHLISGSESVTTIKKVSVKTGASVTIPCSYDGKYKHYVKYLCKGHGWYSCSYEVKTNSRQDTVKYSISDDKTQNILSFTIKQLTASDSYYWCVVEINNGADDGQVFELSVTPGTPSLWVADQYVTGFIGYNITINCTYLGSGKIQWCKLGKTCVTTGKIDGTAVTINKDESNVFRVTMSGLTLKSSGWYYCVKGDLQMPVHLTVTVKPTAAPTTAAATTTVAAATSPTGARKNTTAGEADNRSDWSHLKNLAIPLSVLIFIVIVALSILFILRGSKRVKVKDSTASKNEEDLTYANVTFKKNRAAQAVSDADVTYSSVVSVKKQSVRRSEGKDEDVTYSTVTHPKQNV